MIYYLGGLLFLNVKQNVLRIVFLMRSCSSLMKVSVVILSIRLLLLIYIIYYLSFIHLYIVNKQARTWATLSWALWHRLHIQPRR